MLMDWSTVAFSSVHRTQPSGFVRRFSVPSPTFFCDPSLSLSVCVEITQNLQHPGSRTFSLVADTGS